MTTPFSFGATTGSTPGFSFGSSAATTTTTAAPITFGAPAAAATTAGTSGGISFGSSAATTTTTVPPALNLTGFSLGSAATMAATGTTASPATTRTGAASSTAPATTTTTAAPLAGFGAFAGFGTGAAATTTTTSATTTSTAAASGTGTAAATTTTTAPLAGALALPANAAPAPTPEVALASSRLRHLNVEEIVQLWSRELEEHVHSFVEQAQLVQKWDSVMLENFKKIVQLQNQVRNVQVAQVKLNALLDTIKSHQSDFNILLDQLESSVDQLPKRSQLSVEELKREEAFALAEEIDSTLLNMGDQLTATIQTLNAHTDQQLDPSNPLSAVLKILNVHQNSLSWLDSTATELQNSLTATQRNVSQLQIQDQTQMRGMKQEYGQYGAY